MNTLMLPHLFAFLSLCGLIINFQTNYRRLFNVGINLGIALFTFVCGLLSCLSLLTMSVPAIEIDLVHTAGYIVALGAVIVAIAQTILLQVHDPQSRPTIQIMTIIAAISLAVLGIALTALDMPKMVGR